MSSLNTEKFSDEEIKIISDGFFNASALCQKNLILTFEDLVQSKNYLKSIKKYIIERLDLLDQRFKNIFLERFIEVETYLYQQEQLLKLHGEKKIQEAFAKKTKLNCEHVKVIFELRDYLTENKRQSGEADI
jgi:hypothetical protein